MGVFLLAATLLMEIAGVGLSYWYGFSAFGHWLAVVWNPLFPDRPVSLAAWGLVFVAANLFIHLAALAVAAVRLQLRLQRLGASSERQEELVRQVYNQVTASAVYRAGYRLDMPPLFKFSPSKDLQIGFVGRTLVIRDTLLKSRFLSPLLMHELAHYNSADVWLRLLLSLFPPPLYGLGVVVGLGVGLGPLIMYFPWKWYWRKREYDADTFVLQLGYAEALIEALETLRLPRNREKNILLREVPYAEERIDHLRRLQRPLAAP